VDLRPQRVVRAGLALALLITLAMVVGTATAAPNTDLYDPNVELADNFFPPNMGNQLIVDTSPGATTCASNTDLTQPSTIHIAQRSSGYAFIPSGGWLNGALTWDLTATIGAQTKGAVSSFWPLNDNGAPIDSSGLHTGALQSVSGHFTIHPYDTSIPDIVGTVTGTANAANWGVCRNFANETTESPINGGWQTGAFYIINAGVLTYQVTSGPSGVAGETGDATAYFMNSYSNWAQCDGCLPDHMGARAGHFRLEFGTTVLGGGVVEQQVDAGPAQVTVEPIPNVQITFSDITGVDPNAPPGPTGVNVVQTTDAPSLPGSFQLAGSFFYEIYTNLAYTSPITICLPTDALPQGSTPQILHYANGAWESPTTTVNGNVACAQVTSLSPFALGTNQTYTVSGPFQPVDPQPTVNLMKAGRTVPVKFKLGGDFGLNVFASGYPQSQAVQCASGTPSDDVETTSTSNSGLTYDATTGTYSYNWKTSSTWKNQCRTLTLQFADNQQLKASFKFN
jgi:hypothetical protein